MQITTEYIKLDSFLKAVNAVSSGGEAKILITDGAVKVNGEIELRRGRKLRPGDKVDLSGREYSVRGGEMPAINHLMELYLVRIGEEIHVGEWLTIDQVRIDAFAAATGDIQWIHTDPEKARIESPYRATVAHGFLTLSLLPLLTGSNSPGMFESNYPGMKFRINYGLERVRFPAPVRAGARVRARTRVTGVEEVSGGVQIAYLVTIEIEGETKPACVAEQLFRLYPEKL